jgi:hypothetical protein
VAEIDGDTKSGVDKIAARRMRLLSEVEGWRNFERHRALLADVIRYLAEHTTARTPKLKRLAADLAYAMGEPAADLPRIPETWAYATTESMSLCSVLHYGRMIVSVRNPVSPFRDWMRAARRCTSTEGQARLTELVVEHFAIDLS